MAGNALKQWYCNTFWQIIAAMDRRIVLRTKLSLECRFERSERNMALVNVREDMYNMF